MKNEVIREYENKDIIIYKRVGRNGENIPLYFIINKNEKKRGVSTEEFRNIRQVRVYIKNLTII